LFIIGAKLIGIYAFVLGIFSAVNTITFTVHELNFSQLVFATLSYFILLLLSLFLLLKTETIATLIDVPDTKTLALNIDLEHLFRLGISLIALKFFVWNVGHVIAEFNHSLSRYSAYDGFSNFFWQSLIITLFGILLVVFATQIATLILKVQDMRGLSNIELHSFDSDEK